MFENPFRRGRSTPIIPRELVLRQLSANVMLADADLTITYLNPAPQEMLQGIESDLRRDLPQFDAQSGGRRSASLRGGPDR